jgi:hypothetical protein
MQVKHGITRRFVKNGTLTRCSLGSTRWALRDLRLPPLSLQRSTRRSAVICTTPTAGPGCFLRQSRAPRGGVRGALARLPKGRCNSAFRAAAIVNLCLLCRRNFGLGTLASFLVGFALYAAAYLLLQYLAVTEGFDVEQAGEVVAWSGLPQRLVIPLVPLLMKRIDAHLLVGAGLLVFGASCFMNLDLDLD